MPYSPTYGPPLLIFQTLLDSQASLEQERAQLVGSQTSLQTQVQQLQSSLSQVQQELQESHSELEACRRGEGHVPSSHVRIDSPLQWLIVAPFECGEFK